MTDLHPWLRDHYPIPASECPPQDALEHSLRKWRGLRPEALARHGCTAHCGAVLGVGFTLPIGSETCALCKTCFGTRCQDCPITRSRGAACDKQTEDEEERDAETPWAAWVLDLNPEPMIAALEQAQKWQAKQESP